MAIALGKRKRATVTTKPVTQPRPLKAPKAAPKPARKPVAPSVPSPAVTKAQSEEKEGDESDSEDLQAIFRRAFEAKFKPLPDAEHKQKTEAIAAPEDEDEEMEEGEGEEDDDAWDGISEVADEVEVIEHADVRRAPEERLDKRQMRAFMSSKPPTASESAGPTASNKKQKSNGGDNGEDDGTDAANLKNDLALQRLLNESHLLEADASDLSSGPAGKNRHKATDLRLLSLGGKTSILEQKNMPLSHRKGIMAKKERKETDRRREAKENGIILERATAAAQKGEPKRRERGIGGSNVGRFTGGTLRLSKRDVADITGPKPSMGKGGKKGGKPKGRR